MHTAPIFTGMKYAQLVDDFAIALRGYPSSWTTNLSYNLDCAQDTIYKSLSSKAIDSWSEK